MCTCRPTAIVATSMSWIASFRQLAVQQTVFTYQRDFVKVMWASSTHNSSYNEPYQQTEDGCMIHQASLSHLVIDSCLYWIEATVCRARTPAGTQDCTCFESQRFSIPQCPCKSCSNKTQSIQYLPRYCSLGIVYWPLLHCRSDEGVWIGSSAHLTFYYENNEDAGWER